MKARGPLLVLICALGTLLVLPAKAVTKPGYYKVQASRSATVDLRGTHGYSIKISASERSLLIIALRRQASVVYFVFREGLKGDRLRGRLPGIGWVHLRFRELRRSHRPPEEFCKGPDTLVRHGVFEGWIRIRGEQNYTRAETHRVLGEVVEEPKTICRERAAARMSGAAGETLTAKAPRGDGSIYLNAFRFPWLDAAYVSAGLVRLRARIAIVNQNAVVSEDAETLSVARPPQSATVEPPRPFTGTAVFEQESKDDFSWTGDLAVELPGIGEVDLAGPRWESALCVGNSCRGDAEDRHPTPFAQGSGSHSQPLALAKLSSLR